jgi:hypothetical protein
MAHNLALPVDVDSFNAIKYLHGTSRERDYEADKLVEYSGELGISGIYDEEQIVDRRLLMNEYRVLDLLFDDPRLPVEELRPWFVDPTEPDLGIYPPGAESYRLDEPEILKAFIRYGLRGSDRQFPRGLLPGMVDLVSYLGSEDAEFVDNFFGAPMRALHDQKVELTTIGLCALAERYFGLGPGWWRKPEVVTDNSGGVQVYNRVHDNTSQLVIYLLGKDPKPGDQLFGEHVDSGSGTLVIPTEAVLPAGDNPDENEYILTVRAVDGREIRPVAPPGHFFFQYGKTFAAMMANLVRKGKLDPDKLKYGLMQATPHWGLRGPDVSRRRRASLEFVHPDLRMPLTEDGMTAGDILTSDLERFIDTNVGGI